MNKDCWQTPLELFKQLNDKYNFQVDACTSPENALCDYFWTVEDDCLQKDWVMEMILFGATHHTATHCHL